MRDSEPDNMPSPLENPATRRAMIFREGMMLHIEGIPFMSLGLSGTVLRLKQVTQGNRIQCERKFKKLVEDQANADRRRAKANHFKITNNSEGKEPSPDDGG